MNTDWQNVMTAFRHALRRITLFCAAVWLAGPTPASAEDYRLRMGDKVRVLVFGQKDLDQTSAVDMNGKIWFPTVGRIPAADLTIDELTNAVTRVLTGNNMIRPEDINVEIVEYRPFYVVGGVAKPGSYPFTPGLTVRQAVALAGGLARPSSEQLGTLFQTDPRSSYSSLLSDYLHRVARSARLRAELDEQTDFEWQPRKDLNVAPDLAKNIYDLQNSEFRARAEKFEREKQDLDELIDLAQSEISTLEKQNERLEQEDARVTKNLEDLRQLKERGVVSLARIDESQRDVFSSRYARDSTRSQLASARRQQAELISKKKQMDFARREEITREMNLANAEIDVLQAQMTSAAARTELAGDGVERYCALENREEGLFINRLKDGRSERLAATEDTEVKPGDTLEVNVVSELLRLTCRSRKAAGGNAPNAAVR